MSELADLLEEISNFPIDREFLPQEKLDIEDRGSTSLYPWRGQFSPGLVELLLGAHAQSESVVLDPFVGSGTTLVEASKRDLECYGVEINPAAIQLSGMSRFANVDHSSRERIFDEAEKLLKDYLGKFLRADLFGPQPDSTTSGKTTQKAVLEMLEEVSDDPLLHNLIAASVMIAMGNGDVLEAESLYAALRKNRLAASRLPLSYRACRVFTDDARNLPLVDQGVDLVLTSPPYINVFNYHQHYRRALELMGWLPLEVAPSEIGSNRKHRSNRFLTVIQYCMDLAQTFAELRRVLAPKGTAIFVIGRETTVKGMSFDNSTLLATTAAHAAHFHVNLWQERKFVNRYGESIYEDIITLSPDERVVVSSEEYGREVGTLALEKALGVAGNNEVVEDISRAIKQSTSINPSPLLVPSSKHVG